MRNYVLDPTLNLRGISDWIFITKSVFVSDFKPGRGYLPVILELGDGRYFSLKIEMQEPDDAGEISEIFAVEEETFESVKSRTGIEISSDQSVEEVSFQFIEVGDESYLGGLDIVFSKGDEICIMASAFPQYFSVKSTLVELGRMDQEYEPSEYSVKTVKDSG